MRVLSIVVLWLMAATTYAQQLNNLKGKVVDSQNAALVSASVTCLNNGKITRTDENGNFSLSGLPAVKELKIKVSYTGFVPVEKMFDLSNGDLTNVVITMRSDPLSLSEVVVTGVSSPASKLASSVSVSTLSGVRFQQSSPRTTAELFRTIPGIRSEASGGDGNTNITVRGVPISSGGSKYLQLQEDGLPVLMFGDIAFATSDIFLRADNSIAKLEAIRGGSASTLATNSPAGIINMISKTGATEGGSISSTFGLNYGSTRTNFNFGSPVGNGWSFHVGGFYRTGEGPRTAGFNANNGGQFKANLTKEFKSGYARLYVKHLNDRAAAYMPMPVQVTGTNKNPEFSSLPGFDVLTGALQSPYLLQSVGLGTNGELRRSSVADGMHPISSAIGAEFQFNLENGWTIENRGRFSSNKGNFAAPFPAMVDSRANVLTAVGAATSRNLSAATLQYAVDGSTYTGDKAMVIHLFDTELSNFNNFVNDFKVRKSIDKVNLTLGYFKANQNIDMSWLWNSYLMDVNGDGAKMLNIVSGGNSISQNGLFAYGVPMWGNLHRNYNTQYDISAPYLSASAPVGDRLNLDASIRYDLGKVRGSYAGNAQTKYDVNNDGIISETENSVSAINFAAAKPVKYDYDYVSFSLGANYMINKSQAVFARYSNGAAAKADRILFSANVFSDGSAVGVTDKIAQAEAGYKYQGKNTGLFLTAFYAKTNESGGYEATTQSIIENDYESMGLELEGVNRFTKNIELRGGLTYTHAEITSGVNKGNRPRRQADLIFSLMPTFTYSKVSAGLSIIGTTKSYAQDNNKLILPGYAIVSPFVNYNLNKRLTLSLNANNLFNSIGFTESEEGNIVENQTNIIRARSIAGRTIAGGLSFNF